MKKSFSKTKIITFAIVLEIVLLFVINFGFYDKDTNEINQDLSVTSNSIHEYQTVLNKGIYEVNIIYSTNGNTEDQNAFIRAFDPENSAYDVYSDQLCLWDYGNEAILRIYVNDNQQPVTIGVYEVDESVHIVIEKAHIKTKEFLSRVYFLFQWMIAFFVLDMILLYELFVKEKWSVRKKQTVVILVGVALIASMPLMTDSFISGHDWEFHFSRIGYLAEELKNGTQFPVRVQTGWLNGYGYALGMSYGDVFLYFPSLLYCFGLPLQLCYKILVFIFQLMTVAISYWSFFEISKSRKASTMGAMLYTLGSWHLLDFYLRTAVGEAIAYTFLPLLFLSMWFWVTGNQNDKLGEFSVPVLFSISYTGLIESHIITTLLATISVGVFLLIHIRRLFQKESFLQLLWGGIFTLGLNLWFILPLMEYYVTNQFSVGKITPTIQQYGVYVQELFAFDYNVGGKSWTPFFGVKADMPQTIGVASMLVIPIAILVFFEMKKGKKRLIAGTLCMLLVYLWLATIYFPYDAIAKYIPFFYKFLSVMQCPWRWLSFAAASASLLVVLCFCNMEKTSLKKYGTVIMMGLAVLCIVESSYLNSKMILEAETRVITNVNAIEPISLSGWEYIPDGASADIAKGIQTIEVSEGISIERSGWQNGVYEIQVKEKSTGDAIIPVFYYKDYHAYDKNGKEIEVHKNSDGRILLHLDNYSGKVFVKYKEPLHWRALEIMSVLFVLLFIIILKRAYKIKN